MAETENSCSQGPYTLNNGKERPAVTVAFDTNVQGNPINSLVKGTDYIVNYEGWEDGGEAIVTVTGIGNKEINCLQVILGKTKVKAG